MDREALAGLTGRQIDALKELMTYRYSGARQSVLAARGYSRALLWALHRAGFAESIESTIGRGWYITPAGTALLAQESK